MSEEFNKIVAEAIKLGAIPEGWQEVEINFFTFDNPGDFIVGNLIEKSQQKVGNNVIGRYTLSREPGDRISFLGTTQLDQKMKLITKGRMVAVIFDHEEPASDKDKNPMKFFKVIIKPETRN